MFPPRYHGTVFNVVYEPQTSAKEPAKSQKVHLITSLDTAELLKSDWTDAIHKFHPADIDHIDNKKTAVVLVMKPGSQVTTMTLTTKPESSESLNTALTQILAIPKPAMRFLALTQLLPTFKFPSRREEMDLHKEMMDTTLQLIQSFVVAKGGTAQNGQLVDALTSVYRMRYRNSFSHQPDSAKDVALLFRRWFVVTWANAVARSARPNDNPAYFSKLAVNAANTLLKAAGSISVPVDDLAAAAAAYAESGTPGGLEAIANRVRQETQGAIDADIAKTPPCDPGHLFWMLDLALMILSGIITGMYTVDIEDLAEKIVQYTQAAASKGSRAEELKKALIDEQRLFLGNLLQLLDGQRYEVKFQYIYAVWPFRRELPPLGSLTVD